MGMKLSSEKKKSMNLSSTRDWGFKIVYCNFELVVRGGGAYVQVVAMTGYLITERALGTGGDHVSEDRQLNIEAELMFCDVTASTFQPI
jgi:hypothetical protein